MPTREEYEESVEYESDVLSGDEDEGAAELSDEEREAAPKWAPQPSALDPRSDRVLLLPSLFKDRPATIWFDYPLYMQLQRVEGRELTQELTDKRLRPLWFKADRNINCIANAFKRSGFRRLVKGYSFNLYWGHHLQEKAFNNLRMDRKAPTHL